MPISVQDIESLFERYGWKCQPQDEKTILVSFQGETGNFVMGARINEDWLTLTITNYLPPVPPEKQVDVYRYVLELNSRICLAKFALEPDDRIIVTTELYAKTKPDYDLFSRTVDLLSLYAEDAYPHLYKRITDEEPPTPEQQDNE